MAQELSYAELEGLWVTAGGDPSKASVAAAIALAESSGIPDNVQKGEPYSTTGWGLWQITPGNSVPSVGTDNQLLDPLTNARAAVAKFSGSGGSFRPWTTYTSGKYLTFLQPNVPPADAASVTSLSGDLGSLIPGADSVSGVGSTVHLLGRLVDPNFWKRVGKMAIALLVGLLAASFLFSGTRVGEEAKDAAEKAGVAAAMA